MIYKAPKSQKESGRISKQVNDLKSKSNLGLQLWCQRSVRLRLTTLKFKHAKKSYKICGINLKCRSTYANVK